MAAVKFSKQGVQPNPIEVDYWVDIKSDPYGSVWKYFNGADWVDFSLSKGSGGGGMYPFDYYTKVQVNQLLNNKLDVKSDLYQPFLLEGANIKIDRNTNTISAVGELSVDWDTIPNVPNNLVTSVSTEDEVINVDETFNTQIMKIRTLVDLDTKEQFVPRTHVKAVVDDNGDSIYSIIENFEIEFKEQKNELNELSQELQSDTEEAIETMTDIASNASTAAEEAINKSDEAINTANTAKNAVATLEGLADADLSAITAAGVVTQVEQNKFDIQSILNSEEVLSKEQYKELEKNGEVDLTKKYYIYDN